jgi:hypothetical protein
MSENVDRHEKALKLVERLIEIAPDAGMKRRAMKLAAKLALPIDEILAKVPGNSVIAKAKAIGVTRQAIYSWRDGVCRPNRKQAKRIERLTGFDADDVRGVPDDPL